MKSTIEIVNVRYHGKPVKPWEVYIGRYNNSWCMRPSPLRNKFQAYDYGHKGCLAKFEKFFQLAMYASPPITDQCVVDVREETLRLHRLLVEHGKLILVCWCAGPDGLTSSDPPICHGQIIAKFLEGYAEADRLHQDDKPGFINEEEAS